MTARLGVRVALRLRAPTVRLGALLAVCLCGPAAPLTAAPTAVSGAPRIDNPRAFGHFVGDPLDRSIDITVPPGYALAPESLPLPQRQGAWLELQSVRPRSTVTAHGLEVRVDLHYQIVNSPTQLLQTALPGMTLHFTDGADSFDTVVDALPILVSPLASGPRDPALSMRPSRAPLPIDLGPSEGLLVAALSAAALFMAGAFAPRLSAYVHGRGSGPFERAHRTLHELASGAPGIERHRAALRAVHRAFDETAGNPVFAEKLEPFFEAHPAFAASRVPVWTFYAASRLEFFGGGNASDDTLRIERLLSLCAHLRACERRARG